jgi:hypothetical protein
LDLPVGLALVAVVFAGCAPVFGGAGWVGDVVAGGTVAVAAFAGVPTVCVSEIEGVVDPAVPPGAAAADVSGPKAPNAAGHAVVAVFAAVGVAAAGVEPVDAACGSAMPPVRDRRQSSVAKRIVLVLGITSNSYQVRLRIGGCLLLTSTKPS